MSVFRRHHPDPPTRAPRDVERAAENVAAQVSAATDQLEAAFRRLQPVLDNVPAVINSHRPTPGGRP